MRSQVAGVFQSSRCLTEDEQLETHTVKPALERSWRDAGPLATGGISILARTESPEAEGSKVVGSRERYWRAIVSRSLLGNGIGLVVARMQEGAINTRVIVRFDFDEKEIRPPRVQPGNDVVEDLKLFFKPIGMGLPGKLQEAGHGCC